MKTETPQTEIASNLAQSLHKRSLDDIQRSWDHQKPEVDRAIAGLRELGDILQLIQSLHIYDQHKQISDDCLDDWLWRFKDFFYAMENLLDDLDFIEFGSDVSEFEETHFVKAIEKLPDAIETARGLLIEIKQLKEELETLKPVCCRLDQQINAGLGTLPYKVRELKGRAVEKTKIQEALLRKAEEESKGSPVLIWITGPVGIGKTDLARAVYNSEQVEVEFDVRVWIYMGNDRRDDNRLTLQRSESASVHQLNDIHSIVKSSLGNSILETKKTEIKGKKVLIVLDNLTEGYLYADLFKYGAKVGSRIIVTSQFRYAGKSHDLLLDVELDGLEEEEYLELFKECALGDRNRKKHPELEDIVGEIAKRYGGNPLAAVTIGRLLKSQPDEDHWRIISRSNLSTIDPTESNILSLLRRSYEQLPWHSKQCYLACALFPKYYAFEQGQLLRIWNATGFSSNDSFGVLSDRSFFVSSDRDNGKFVLHATLHELADCICDGEFFRLEEEIKEEDDIEIPHKAQHVYVTADNFAKVGRVLQKKTHLRSLVIRGILSSQEYKTIFMELLEEVLLNLKDLRLLMISVLPTGKLPDVIGRLRHLRYLELPGESIQVLPTWLSNDRFVGLRGFRHLDAKSIALLKELPTQKSKSVRARPTPKLKSVPVLIPWKSTESKAILRNPSSVQKLPTWKSTESKEILRNPSSVQKLPSRKSIESKAILRSRSSVQKLPSRKSTESKAILRNPSSVQKLPSRKSTESKAILKNSRSFESIEELSLGNQEIRLPEIF